MFFNIAFLNHLFPILKKGCFLILFIIDNNKYNVYFPSRNSFSYITVSNRSLFSKTCNIEFILGSLAYSYK